MGNFFVKKSVLSGSLKLPSSKSHTLRALLFASLAEGKSTIKSPLNSPDTEAMLQACAAIGAVYEKDQESIYIEGVKGITGAHEIINAGNSGLVLRFMTAICALGSEKSMITGDVSICYKRPMQPLIRALESLGARIISTKGDGLAPLIIQGPIRGGKVTVEGSDSQFVSALLIASIFMKRPLELTVVHPGEKPWVNLTLEWLKRLGVRYANENYEKICVENKGSIKSFEYLVPKDWSAALFPIGAAIVTGSKITLDQLDKNDSQGDKEALSVLEKMRSQIDQEVDVNDFIDALPILAAVACFAKSATRIKNGFVARSKECDRIACMTKELKKMGAQIVEHEDGMTIYPSQLHGGKVDSHGDHRVAMALATAALGANGETVIENTECVKKTFPDFAKSFRALGAEIEER